jgi:GntR family negative regulator for fad regulon and positive regulator of fabA
MVRPLTTALFALPATRRSSSSAPLPLRPAAHAEAALVEGILNGTYPPGSELPAERGLADALGVTRPTLREALKRLERDGWVTIPQGKSTRVRDVLREGGLNVLGALVRHGAAQPEGFIEQLLEIRLVMAPAYTCAAIERSADEVATLLRSAAALPDDREAFATFDWDVHAGLSLASGNFVYRLILNGFAGFYQEMARSYFATEEARAVSRRFYRDLLAAAENHEAERAEAVTRRTMAASLELWRAATRGEKARP